MKIEILNLAATLEPSLAERASSTLQALRGVQSVKLMDEPPRLFASIDEDETGRAELVTVLARLGVRVTDDKRAEGGGCCGSCGGQR